MALGLDSWPESVPADVKDEYTLLLANAALVGDKAVLEKITNALRDHGVPMDELAR